MRWKVIEEWGIGWGLRVPCSALEDLGLLRCEKLGSGGWGWRARVWAGAKDGQLGDNFKGFWAGDFCCQSWAIQASVFHIVYQATGLFRFPRVPLPPATRPGLVVTCWFKNSSREENDCQLPPRCRMLSPGPARASTRLRASDNATGAAAQGSGASYRRPVPGWGGGQAGSLRAGSSCRPSQLPRRYSQRKLGESGRLALGFVFPTDSAFLRPPRPLPHGSAQAPRSPETRVRPPPGVRARTSRALQPPPRLLGLSPAPVRGRVLREMGRALRSPRPATWQALCRKCSPCLFNASIWGGVS